MLTNKYSKCFRIECCFGQLWAVKLVIEKWNSRKDDSGN